MGHCTNCTTSTQPMYEGSLPLEASSKQVKQYILDVFTAGEGQYTGYSKQKMKTMRLDNGGKGFSPSEWLTEKQIALGFSRLTVKKRIPVTKAMIEQNIEDAVCAVMQLDILEIQ